MPDEGAGVTSDIDEDVDAVDRLRARGASGDESWYETLVDRIVEENVVRATDVSIVGGFMM